MKNIIISAAKGTLERGTTHVRPTVAFRKTHSGGPARSSEVQHLCVLEA